MVARTSGFLLDTNVVSELMKTRPNRRVVEWIDATAEELLYLSVITIGEVRKRIDLLDAEEPKRAALQSWLDAMFACASQAGCSRLTTPWRNGGGSSKPSRSSGD